MKSLSFPNSWGGGAQIIVERLVQMRKMLPLQLIFNSLKHYHKTLSQTLLLVLFSLFPLSDEILTSAVLVMKQKSYTKLDPVLQFSETSIVQQISFTVS